MLNKASNAMDEVTAKAGAYDELVQALQTQAIEQYNDQKLHDAIKNAVKSVVAEAQH